MNWRVLRIFFKAAVIVPFYTACLLALPGILAEVEPLIMLALASGITGLLSTTIFLNHFKRVAYHPLLSALSFFLLPGISVAIMMITMVNWTSFKYSSGDMRLNALVIVVCFLHLIGLSISYVDFRQSIRLTKTLHPTSEIVKE